MAVNWYIDRQEIDVFVRDERYPSRRCMAQKFIAQYVTNDNQENACPNDVVFTDGINRYIGYILIYVSKIYVVTIDCKVVIVP